MIRGLSVSVVIPAKNEARNIGWVLRRMPHDVDEVIVVDGLSTDDTLVVAQELLPAVRVVHDERPGKGRALRAGFAAATCDAIVMLDADGSMDPGEIPRYVGAIRAGAQFVKGTRFATGGGSEDITLLRRLGNLGLVSLVNLLYMARFSDLCYGYMAFRRDCLDELALQATGFEIETEMVVNAVKAGLRIAEVPSTEFDRRSGASNLNTFRDGRRVLTTLLKHRFGPWPDERIAIGPARVMTMPTRLSATAAASGSVIDLTDDALAVVGR